MEIRAFLTLVVPFIVVIYLIALVFVRPTRAAVIASLLGGLVMGLINILFDVAAYYAGWWYYNLNDLTLHVPLPFYITPVLVYGSFVYLLIWRFRAGRTHWFSLLLLFGVPVFGFLRDILSALNQSSYTTWKSPLAGPLTVVMWLLMFYAGYLLFWRLAPLREEADVETGNSIVNPLKDSVIE